MNCLNSKCQSSLSNLNKPILLGNCHHGICESCLKSKHVMIDENLIICPICTIKNNNYKEI